MPKDINKWRTKGLMWGINSGTIPVTLRVHDEGQKKNHLNIFSLGMHLVFFGGHPFSRGTEIMTLQGFGR